MVDDVDDPSTFNSHPLDPTTEDLLSPVRAIDADDRIKDDVDDVDDVDDNGDE